MSFSRRKFLRGLGGAAATLSVSAFWDRLYAAEYQARLKGLGDKNPQEAAEDEDFWAWVRMGYTVNDTNLYFNNGGVSPQSKAVQDAERQYTEMCNQGPSFYMWRILERGRVNLRASLARLMHLDPEEVAINRNTTESLATVIFGLDLDKGDEVVLSKQDYPAMINAWKQREKRDGIKLVWVDLDLPSEDADALTRSYTEAFTKKTRILHLTHMISWNGQLLPAREIVQAAHERDIEVVLDAAHTLGQMDVNFREIGADYMGSSLHKWLGAPFGTGVLAIRKEKIHRVWPLLGAEEPESDDITKFEHLGTRSIPAEFAVGVAIRQHESIGIQRKEARLRWLRDYWVNQVKDLPGFKILSPLDPKFSGGMLLFWIEGARISEMNLMFNNDYEMVVTSCRLPRLKGVRISPNVYTSKSDLDRLVWSIRDMHRRIYKG